MDIPNTEEADPIFELQRRITREAQRRRLRAGDRRREAAGPLRWVVRYVTNREMRRCDAVFERNKAKAELLKQRRAVALVMKRADRLAAEALQRNLDRAAGLQ